MDTDTALTRYDRMFAATVDSRLRQSPDRDDALQEVRIHVWRMCETGKIPTTDKPGSYLKRVAHNRVTRVMDRQYWTGMQEVRGRYPDPLRRSDRDSLDAEDFHYDAPANSCTDDLAYHRTEIAAAVRDLPSVQRQYVYLRFWAGLTGPEIAAKIGRPVGTLTREWVEIVRPRLGAALAHLQTAC